MSTQKLFLTSLRNHRGVSTIDILVSLVIVGLLIAVFLPGALRQGILSNEAVALGGLRTILQTNFAYFSQEEAPVFADSLDTIREAGVYLIPPGMEKGEVGGYDYSMSVGEDEALRLGFSAEAHPQRYRWDGVRSFFVDETGRFRGADAGGFPGTASLPFLAKD